MLKLLPFQLVFLRNLQHGRVERESRINFEFLLLRFSCGKF